MTGYIRYAETQRNFQNGSNIQSYSTELVWIKADVKAIKLARQRRRMGATKRALPAHVVLLE